MCIRDSSMSSSSSLLSRRFWRFCKEGFKYCKFSILFHLKNDSFIFWFKFISSCGTLRNRTLFFGFSVQRIHHVCQSTFAESVRIELTLVLPKPRFSIPVPYHFGQLSFFKSSAEGKSFELLIRRGGQHVFGTSSSAIRIPSIVWVIRFELIQ